jgi:hypothetical protein
VNPVRPVRRSKFRIQILALVSHSTPELHFFVHLKFSPDVGAISELGVPDDAAWDLLEAGPGSRDADHFAGAGNMVSQHGGSRGGEELASGDVHGFLT